MSKTRHNEMEPLPLTVVALKSKMTPELVTLEADCQIHDSKAMIL
jgi:hypothetical protein